MQISRHNETQAHLYGLCGCDEALAPVEMPATRWSHNEDTDDDNIGTRRPRRSVARRRF